MIKCCCAVLVVDFLELLEATLESLNSRSPLEVGDGVEERESDPDFEEPLDDEERVSDPDFEDLEEEEEDEEEVRWTLLFGMEVVGVVTGLGFASSRDVVIVFFNFRSLS